MSRNYDNWERLVAAVIKREEDRRLCHQLSITTSSICSQASSSDFSSSFRSTASISFNFASLFRSSASLPFQTVAGLKTSSKSGSKENLVLFQDSLLAFGLEELLTAPCFAMRDEIETFPSVYMVSLKQDVNIVVMRWRCRWRWKKGYVSSKVFNQRLKSIESMKHENVVRLRGFFISDQDGSFGIYDYFHQGSLQTMLHGKKGKNQADLDWEGRIRIAIGVAMGLLHIHRQGLVHGSVKASNVFLNSQQYGCVDIKPDYEISFESRMCNAPEVNETKVVSQAGDVYSFGVILIELVSGKSPLHYTGRHETYADWGLHNARDELSTMVYDREVVKYSLAKQAMWDLLGVASSCVKKNPHNRPNMNDVAAMLINVDPKSWSYFTGLNFL